MGPVTMAQQMVLAERRALEVSCLVVEQVVVLFFLHLFWFLGVVDLSLP